MTEFTPYPGTAGPADPAAADPGAAPAAVDPASPGERYVVSVTSNLKPSSFAAEPVTEPMTLEAAQELLDKISRGEPCEILDDEVDGMTEVSPGHLLAYRRSTMFSTATTYEIRLARVLWSR